MKPTNKSRAQPRAARAHVLSRAVILCVGTALANTAIASCVLSISSSDVNLGRIVPAEVNPHHRRSGEVSLGRQRGSLDILCPAPTRVALYYRAPALDERSFRVDLAGSGGQARLAIEVSQANADGQPAGFASMHDFERQGHAMTLRPDEGVRLRVRGGEAPVQRASMQFEVDVSAVPSALRADSDLDLVGGGYFELVEQP